MNILLTNDDGIQAEGLAALETAVREAFSPAELWVVAPDRPRSQCSHATTADLPVEATRHGEKRFAVSGYPADCVRVAVFGLGFKPDWVFSGINHGGNLGHDIALSGTVAAAREAAYHGLAAAAISHFIDSGPVDWSLAARRTATALQEIVRKHQGDSFWNINLPHTDPIPASEIEFVHCVPARSPLPAIYRTEPRGDSTQAFHATGSYQSRPRDPGSDVEVCFGGGISISELRI